MGQNLTEEAADPLTRCKLQGQREMDGVVSDAETAQREQSGEFRLESPVGVSGWVLDGRELST